LRVIVSLAMEVALEGSANYAGGLGVLEADKFYASGRLGLPYILIAPFYPYGYVDYNTVDGPRLVEVRHRHSPSFLARLSHVGVLEVRGRHDRLVAEAELFEYKSGSAKAILYRVVRPRKQASLFKYLYRHHDDECLYYITSAAIASRIASKLASEGSVVDVQEAHLALALYMLPRGVRKRFITHTPGPWGHPRLCKSEAEDLLDVSLPSVSTATEAAMEEADEVYAVSRRHAETTRKLFPMYAGKINYVTNAVDLERWVRVRNVDSPSGLWGEHLRLREELESLIAGLTGKRAGGRMIVSWTRRIVKYKRPYYVERLAQEKDLRDRVFLVVAGKPHVWDGWGRGQAERLARLSRELDNIAFHPTYDVEIAKYSLTGADLLLFTPFPGWEASGTSQMKAGVNGVPSLTSRDGASLELVEDGVNGWFFGSQLEELIDIEGDERALKIDEQDYVDFVKRLEKILDMYENRREEYVEVAFNAYRSITPKADIKRLLREYYPELLGG
jgi:starch phosphorylase